jgi:NAD(P) transhydrogenase subunit alpha
LRRSRSPRKSRADAGGTKRAKEAAAFKASDPQQATLLGVGGALLGLIGIVAPPSFMQHFIVFVLSVLRRLPGDLERRHALHTPLMAITNAISSIIILGALLQIGSGMISW